MTHDDPREEEVPDEPASAVVPADDSAVNPRSRRRKENRIEQEAREGEAFWRAALNDPVGRRELWRILNGSGGAHVFETRFLAGPSGVPDPIPTWHARGEQDFGLRLYHKWLALDPIAVARMHAEHDSRFAKPKRK